VGIIVGQGTSREGNRQEIEELLNIAEMEMPSAWGIFKQSGKTDKDTPTQAPLF
jgi:hypothetical protein